MPSEMRVKSNVILSLVTLLLLPSGAYGGMVQATVGAVNFGPAAAPLHIVNPAGGDAATGYFYDGMVKDGAACGGGVLGVGVLQVCLTDLTVQAQAGGAGGALLFGFTEAFPGPIPAGMARDRVDGMFGGPVAAAPGGDQIMWQGFVNAVNISPPGPGGAFAPFVAVDPPLPFGGGHGPLAVAATPAGMNLVLSGTFTVTLRGIDNVNLPDSAVVTFYPNSVPEPGSLFLVSLGGLILFRKLRRARADE